MVLFQYEQNVFKFLSSFYSFLWKFPIQWNKSYEKLYSKKLTSENWIKTFLFIFLTFLLIPQNATVAIGYNFISKSPLNRIENLLMIIACATYGTLMVLFLILLHSMDLLLFCSNYLFNWAWEIRKGKNKNKLYLQSILITKLVLYLKFSEFVRRHSSRNPKNVSFKKILPFLVVPGLAFGSFLIPFAFVATGYDPLNYLIEALLGNTMYRQNSSIILIFIVRLIYFFLANIEAMRLANYLYCIAILLMDRTKIVANHCASTLHKY